MRNYEVSLIFSPQIEERGVNDLFQQLLSSVQENGGILHGQKMLGKSTLLSPIQRHKEGYAASVSFAINQEKLSELEKKLKEESQILRFLLIQPKRRTVAPQKEISSSKVKDRVVGKQEVALEPAAAEQKEEKIDLKDIDKKLEEIFKTM